MSDLEDAVRRIVREELEGQPIRQAYTVAATAKVLGCSQSKIRKMVREDKIRVTRVDGWAVRVPSSELARLLREAP